VTGFPPGTYTGTKNVANPAAAGAEANVTIAYNNAAGRSNCAVSIAGNIGGQTLTPGLYKSTSSVAISSGDLTLSGGGNPNGVFVFQIASAFTTTSGRAVILTNGAQAGNVYWQIGSSATIGTTSTVQGTILTYASITMLAGSHLNGRALARTGDVTLSAATLVVPTVSSPTTYPVTFTESGLTAGTNWAVTFGGVLNTSVGTTVSFGVLSGTYSYAISVIGFIASPSSGSVTVSDGAAAQAISFSAGAAGTFAITFTESGLTSGTNWSVTLGGVLTGSLVTTIGFPMQSGTYSYTVGAVTNYTVSPSSGSVTVNGAPTGQAIAFSSTNGGGSGGGGGGGSSLPGGLSGWTWVAIGIAALVAVAAIGGALAMRHRGAKAK
jgi:hypothetical protein